VNDEFETALGQTLADMAKVDRSTAEAVRASMATLPDRGSNRLSGVGRSISNWARRMRPAFALAGVAILLIVLVGFSMLGRWQTAPVAVGSPTPSASPSASNTPAPSPVPSPSATRLLPTASPETQPAVLTGGYLQPLGWTPDGSRFAILEMPRGPLPDPPGPTIHLFDRSGAEIGSVRGWGFGWTDATHFVVFRTDGTSAGPKPIQGAYLGQIGSTQLDRLPGNYDNLVSGPSGAVALEVAWDSTAATKAQYVVVTAGNLSQRRDGVPAAWSRDGSMLAVFHPTKFPPADAGGGGQVTGWFEVVRSTGKSAASARQIESAITAQVVFSPDGSRVAFRDDTVGEKIGVLNIASGRLQTIPLFGGFTWAANDELLIADLSSEIPSENNSILSWSAKTGQLTTYATGTFVGASGRGIVVVGSDATSTLTWSDNTPGATKSGEFTLGAAPRSGIDGSDWSPDGTSVIVITGDPNYIEDAVILRP
jgi:hypothetical protein